MTTIDKSTNEYFLTLSKFQQLKSAGQLEVGAVYHITDEKYAKVTGASDSTNWTSLTIDGVTKNIPEQANVGNGTITINQGTTQKGTFSVNQIGNTTINLDAAGSTVSGNFDTSGNWNTITINGVTKNIPSGGGGGITEVTEPGLALISAMWQTLPTGIYKMTNPMGGKRIGNESYNIWHYLPNEVQYEDVLVYVQQNDTNSTMGYGVMFSYEYFKDSGSGYELHRVTGCLGRDDSEVTVKDVVVSEGGGGGNSDATHVKVTYNGGMQLSPGSTYTINTDMLKSSTYPFVKFEYLVLSEPYMFNTEWRIPREKLIAAYLDNATQSSPGVGNPILSFSAAGYECEVRLEEYHIESDMYPYTNVVVPNESFTISITSNSPTLSVGMIGKAYNSFTEYSNDQGIDY